MALRANEIAPSVSGVDRSLDCRRGGFITGPLFQIPFLIVLIDRVLIEALII